MTTSEKLSFLMDRGYLIYEDPATKTYTIQKIATPLDPRPFIEVFDHTKVSGFPSKDCAIDAALEYHEEVEITHEFIVEAKFNDGLGPKFKTLGSVKETDIAQAEIKAADMAEDHFSRSKVKYTTRVRPKNPELPMWN
jgi:hypothetical protein